jgi:hypothetical protein
MLIGLSALNVLTFTSTATGGADGNNNVTGFVFTDSTGILQLTQATGLTTIFNVTIPRNTSAQINSLIAANPNLFANSTNSLGINGNAATVTNGIYTTTIVAAVGNWTLDKPAVGINFSNVSTVFNAVGINFSGITTQFINAGINFSALSINDSGFNSKFLLAGLNFSALSINDSGFASSFALVGQNFSNTSSVFSLVAQNFSNTSTYLNAKYSSGSSATLADLNVTSGVNISGNLKVDGGTIYADTTLNLVGINTSSPSSTFDVHGSATFNITSGSTLTLVNASGPIMTIYENGTTTYSNGASLGIVNSTCFAVWGGDGSALKMGASC